MTKKRIGLRRGCLIAIAVYILIIVVSYFAAGDQFHYRQGSTDMITPSTTLGELLPGNVVEQSFYTDEESLLSMGLQFATFARENTGHLQFTLSGETGELYAATIDVATLRDNSTWYVTFPEAIENIKGQVLTIRIESIDGTAGNAVTVYLGNYVAVGKVDIPQKIAEKDRVSYNGAPLDNKLCFKITTRTNLWFGDYYWYLAAALGVVIVAYCGVLLFRQKRNKKSATLNLLAAYERYKFLLRQLVARDFKRKYKRSVLGIFWSFLNPLLMMVVQYIVFSTLFKSGIPNFAVYLLIGIVCFSFFNEATGVSLTSIVGNTSLIMKVYVPKYIYPISGVCSSCINLALSLIPLVIALFVTGATPTVAWVFLPFCLVCLIAFSTGMGLFLASVMVFFRDVQFLWGVVSILWMYLTPIFYPDSIIPEQFMPYYKMNPLYQIIRFMRSILMDGASPEPKAYLYCIIASFIPLLIGAYIFRKTQNNFVLHL